MIKYTWYHSFPEKEKLRIDQAVHEGNKLLCELFGDNSQPSWELAPPEMRQSTRNSILLLVDHPGGYTGAAPRTVERAETQEWLVLGGAEGQGQAIPADRAVDSGCADLPLSFLVNPSSR